MKQLRMSWSSARVQRPRRRLACVAAWLLIVLCCMVLGVGLWWLIERGNLKVDAALREHGVTTTATIVRTDPGNHNSVRYSYIVDGQTYENQSSADDPNPDADQLSAGDQITITYDARDPRTACACTPRETRQDWGLIIFAGAILGGFFVGVVVWARYRLRARRGTPSAA